MSFAPPADLKGPVVSDHAQMLLYKIAAYISGVISGSFGFLVRGNVNVTDQVAPVVTRAGYTTGLTTTRTILSANANRVFYLVDNRTGVDVFLRKGNEGALTTVGGYDIRIPSGFSVSESGYLGPVQMICAATASATGVNVSEASSA